MSDELVDRCACGHFAVMHDARGICRRGHQTPVGTMPSPKEPAPCSCMQWRPICAACGYPVEPRCPCVERSTQSFVEAVRSGFERMLRADWPTITMR